MDRGTAVVLTAVAGGLVACQAPVNSRLGKVVDTFPAAAISFAIGLVILVAIVAVAGQAGHATRIVHVPWWYLIGGVLGAVYVSTVLVSVRSLGAGGVTAATIAGQLATAVVLDHFGWLGLARHPVDAARIAGVLLLAAGVFLIVRN